MSSPILKLFVKYGKCVQRDLTGITTSEFVSIRSNNLQPKTNGSSFRKDDITQSLNLPSIMIHEEKQTLVSG
jgi:hypothetical protein